MADTSLPGSRVIRELDAVIAWRGLPRRCVSDNGPEFNGLAMLGWAQGRGLDWHYIEPGPFAKLRVRAAAERVHRKLQWPPARRVPERVAVHHAAQARIELEEWRRDYNVERPHSALGNLISLAYAARNASGPQQVGALRSTRGLAPQRVSILDMIGPNDERILLSTR